MSGTKVDFKVTGMDNVLDLLRQLPPEVVSKNGGPVRTSLRAGALVIAEQARANVRKVVSEPNVDGKPSRSTGALEASIVVTRARKGAFAKSGTGEKFIVWVKKGAAKKYINNLKNRRAGRTTWTSAKEYTPEGPTFYGRFLEYGTKKMREHQWLRPAFAQKREEAAAKIEATLVKRLDRLVKRLSKTAK